MSYIPLWIRNSRKAQIALGTILSILLTRLCRLIGLPAKDAMELTASFAVIASAWMYSIATEDAAQKKQVAPPSDGGGTRGNPSEPPGPDAPGGGSGSPDS